MGYRLVLLLFLWGANLICSIVRIVFVTSRIRRNLSIHIARFSASESPRAYTNTPKNPYFSLVAGYSLEGMRPRARLRMRQHPKQSFFLCSHSQSVVFIIARAYLISSCLFICILCIYFYFFRSVISSSSSWRISVTVFSNDYADISGFTVFFCFFFLIYLLILHPCYFTNYVSFHGGRAPPPMRAMQSWVYLFSRTCYYFACCCQIYRY